MRKQKRWRYYCDHCKKSGGSQPHMIKHESVCTANPNRHCQMCIIAGVDQRPISELTVAYAIGFRELVKVAHNCPACILAGRRQYEGSELHMFAEWDDNIRADHEAETAWNWKDACTKFWETHNVVEEAWYG